VCVVVDPAWDRHRRARPGGLSPLRPDLRPLTPNDMIGHSFPTLEEKPYIPTMPNIRILPVLTALALIPLWAWAQAQAPAPLSSQPSVTPAETPAGAVATPVAPAVPVVPAAPASPGTGASTPAPAPETEAEKTIADAVKKLRELTSVSAVLTEEVEMLKTRFGIKGRYLKAPGSRFRLELTVDDRLPDAEKSIMLQNCDGVWLWDYQKVLESRNYRKMKIDKILEKLKSAEFDDTFREQITSQLGFAGPDALLIGLKKVVQFDQKTAETLDGKPVWLVAGMWRSREGLLGPNQQPLPPTGPLPSYVPELVKVWIGQQDGWPYRVELLGRVPTILLYEDTRRVGPDGRPIGSRNAFNIQKVEPTKITLVYSDVKLNPTIEEKDFAFTAPADARVDDSTEIILNGLEQRLQMLAAQKKAEAAKASESVLPESIEIPKAATEPRK
jgi:outer membrane lipoprotein-sorting protein